MLSCHRRYRKLQKKNIGQEEETSGWNRHWKCTFTLNFHKHRPWIPLLSICVFNHRLSSLTLASVLSDQTSLSSAVLVWLSESRICSLALSLTKTKIKPPIPLSLWMKESLNSFCLNTDPVWKGFYVLESSCPSVASIPPPGITSSLCKPLSSSNH